VDNAPLRGCVATTESSAHMPTAFDEDVKKRGGTTTSRPATFLREATRRSR